MCSLNWKHWGVKGRYDAQWHPNAVLNDLGSPSFNTFIENVLNTCPGYVSELFFSFTKPGISFIGKTENLVADMRTALSLSGLTPDENALRLPPNNSSTTFKNSIEWDLELRRSVFLSELPSILRYGYLTAEDCREYNLPPSLLASNKSAMGAISGTTS